MSTINITLPDGSVKQAPKDSTPLDIAQSISQGLARATLVCEVDGQLYDVFRPIDHDVSLKLLTIKDEKALEVMRHSAAHVFAQALLRLKPNAKITIGPPIEHGFYYDVDVQGGLTDEELPAIEEEMKKIVKENHVVSRKVVSKAQAKTLFPDNEYKNELLDDFEGEISVYTQGEFSDLCRGPHVPKLGLIGAFKLTKTAQVYWRANANNKQLTRVYGVVYPTKKELDLYFERLEQAKLRDHRKIAPEMELTMIHEYAPGMPFFLPKGTIIYNTLVDFIRKEYAKRGYDEVITPQLFNKKLWETSGHWEHYKDDMFILNVDGQEFSLKPMNCPSHCLIFNKKARSYRDLPLRIADFCNLHRNELSGTLSGLTRVRKFAQDDGHIFCTFDQVEDEIINLLSFIKYVWEDIFGFKLNYALSTRPEKKLGDDALWDNAEGMLINALKKVQISYTVKPGEGAFYGPKIDIDIEDALGRRWQCPTCQLDFNMTNRFNCQYEGADGKKHTAVMIHRAVLGSLERFFALMVEHYSGKFPLWLSPEQVRVIPVSDKFNEYGASLQQLLKEKGIRATFDDRRESVSKKVRDAQIEHVNYSVVVGEREQEQKTVTVRSRTNEILGTKPFFVFIEELLQEISSKK